MQISTASFRALQKFLPLIQPTRTKSMKMLGKQMRAACGMGRGDYPVLDTPPTPNENMPSVLHKHSCFEAALPHAAAIERIVIARRVIGCRALCDCHGEGSFSPLPGQLGGREGVPEVKDLPRTAVPICRKKMKVSLTG